MAENAKTHLITIDLSQFKLHIDVRKKIELTLHFNSPSRRFYLSVIALVVNEMKRQGKIMSIPLEGHHELLALLNDTVGGSAGSSEKENLLPRIYRKWQHALPNLEEAPLFKVLGRRKNDEGTGKTYPLTETEKDIWANLFEYMGSEENVRLKLAIDKIGATLNDVVIIFDDSQNAEAWDKFISSLNDGRKEEVLPMGEPAKLVIPEPPVIETPPPQEPKISWIRGYRWLALVVAVVVVLGAITLAMWKTYLKPDRDDVASIKKMAFPLPDKPSIAVLPFVNLSGDPNQEFFCDAMTEEIITALSKVPTVFVIARSSTSTYKGSPIKVKQVSEELGVRYVLEGGIQRSDDRVRITAQLIDAITGTHIWAERYDREIKDIFALQDEITMKILTGVQVKFDIARARGGELFGGDASRAEKYAEKYYSGKQGLDCYLKLAQAAGHLESFKIEGLKLAKRMAEESIAICPDNPEGYLILSWIYLSDVFLGNTNSPRETLEKAAELANKTITMDSSNGGGHSILGGIYLFKREHEKAISEAELAVSLHPNNYNILVGYASVLTYSGMPNDAIQLLQKAIRLNPFGQPRSYIYLGHALRMTGRFEEAVSAYKKAIEREPNSVLAHVGLTTTYSMMGLEREARSEAAEVLKLNPKFSVDSAAKKLMYKEQSENDKIVNAWRKAGLK